MSDVETSAINAGKLLQRLQGNHERIIDMAAMVYSEDIRQTWEKELSREHNGAVISKRYRKHLVNQRVDSAKWQLMVKLLIDCCGWKPDFIIGMIIKRATALGYIDNAGGVVRSTLDPVVTLDRFDIKMRPTD